MVKKMVVVLLAVGLLGATARQDAKIDTKWVPTTTTGVVKQAWNILYTDSSNNAYTFWAISQDPIAVSGDTIVYVYRQYQPDGSGFIAITATIDGGVTWMHDERVNEDAGLLIDGGRYPSAEIAVYPIASWAELEGGWGHPMVAAGDYITPDLALGVDPGNFSTHKSIAKRLPDGNVAVFGVTTGDEVLTYVFDPNTGTIVGTVDTAITAVYPTAIVPDYANGKIWLLAWDDNVGYRGWALDINNFPAVIDSIDFPLPPVVECGTYTDSLGTHPDTIDVFNWMWLDGAVLNDGTPVVVADMFRNNPTYFGLQQGIVLMRPDTTFYVLGPDSLLNVYYPQLSYDAANNVLALFWEQMVEPFTGADTVYGWGRYEVYMMYSLDGGYTWTAPEKVLGDSTINVSMLQVCRNMQGGRVYLAYMLNAADPMYDIYMDVWTDATGASISMEYDYFGYLEPVGIRESHGGALKFTVKSNIGSRMDIEFALDNATSVKVGLYDVAGRLVKSETFAGKAGLNSISINTGDLPRGVYFVKVSAGDLKGVAKTVVVK